MREVKINVRFVPEDLNGLWWHAQLDGVALWCQAEAPGDAVNGIIEAMRDERLVYAEWLAIIGDKCPAVLS